MISFIKGILVEKFENAAVVDVNGVGYEIITTLECSKNLPEISKEVKVLTYFQVKEDAMVLFGFSGKEEKALFLNLIEVNGVGPKSAMQILSGADITSLISAVVSGNSTAISKIKGVGKKTAERIVLELKEKLAKQFGSNFTAMTTDVETNDDNLSQIQEDAALGLMSLGLTKKESAAIVKEVSSSDDTLAEQIIAKALRRL